MKRRDFLSLACGAGAVVVLPRVATAQAKVPRVVLVTGAIAVDQMEIGKDVNWGAFIDQMARNGFVEGRTVSYDRQLVPQAPTPAIAQDNARRLLALSPDAFFWGGSTSNAIAALALNKTIPMIVESTDLFSEGVVTNVGRPGGNVSGVSVSAGPEYEGKKLALLAEAVSGARTIAYANSGANGQFRTGIEPFVKSVGDAAAKLRLTLVPIVYAPGGGEAEFKKVFAAIAASKAEMVLFGAEPSLTATSQQEIVAQLALAARVPAMFGDSGFVAAGGLMTYGANFPELARRCADYVAQVINGTKPGDLPVLQPAVFDLSINLKTARAIGVAIPQSILTQATRIIE